MITHTEWERLNAVIDGLTRLNVVLIDILIAKGFITSKEIIYLLRKEVNQAASEDPDSLQEYTLSTALRDIELSDETGWPDVLRGLLQKERGV